MHVIKKNRTGEIQGLSFNAHPDRLNVEFNEYLIYFNFEKDNKSLHSKYYSEQSSDCIGDSD